MTHLQNFIDGMRWDIVITLFLSLFLEIILMIKRSKINKTLKNKKEIFQWIDFAFSVTTSATFYGGVSAIYFSAKGQLLFNMEFIISQEYMLLFAGLVLIGFAYSTFRTAIKSIRGKNAKKTKD